MYQVERSSTVVAGHRSLLSGERVPRTVVLLGLTSLFTDISSEMVATILPLYLVVSAGFSPLQYGVVDGIYGGATALVRLGGGFVGDRFRRHKEVAAVGYGISAFCKPFFLLLTSLPAIGALVFLDRAGKGIRTAPRDALISLSARQSDLGVAFGVHRALDTTGAMLGPLLAFALLAASPGSFDSVFVVSFCVALVGLGILVLFVQNQERDPSPAPAKVSLREAARLMADERFRSLVVVGGLLALFTISEGFLFLGLQQRLELDLSFFPLLFVGTALVYMLLAIPVGRLADRVGRTRVLLAGYVLLLVAYSSLLVPVPAGAVAAYVLVLGVYHASTDGVLMALASSLIRPELRGSGLALVVTATSVAALASSVAFGALWTIWGLDAATYAFGGGLVVAIAASALLLRRIDHAVTV